MKLKDLFQSTKIINSSSLQELAREVESSDYIESYNKDRSRYFPNVDYSNPSNFAFFGSAEKYYVDGFERIRSTYPYDGSEKEKYDWINESSYLDIYLFEKQYPRYNGYATLSYPEWGTLSGTIIDGYGKSTTNTYIKTFGGPNQSSLSGLQKKYDDANIIDATKSRESNLKFDLSEGVTLEMWLKKPAFNTSKTEKEVLFDLWNGEASSSAQYGRLRLELTGASSGSPFLFTALSGTSGIQNQSFGQNVNTSSIEDWTHIALSLKNSGSDISANFYLNGALNHQQTISSAAIQNVTGSLISYIGALQTAPSGSPTVQEGAGKFSGSLDEFRYWKTQRTSKQIGRYYWTNIGGGTNSDEANTSLGVYYKFNEGITELSTIDYKVLDYSGRVSNGVWTGYQSGARSTGSAIVLSNASPKEYKDPTIYDRHPDYISKLASLRSSGSVHDAQNNASIVSSTPSWILEEEGENGNVAILNHIMASYYDNLYLQIKELNSLKDVYSHFQTNIKDDLGNTSIEGDVKPLPFADRLLTNVGFVAPELFADATVLEALASRSEDEHYEMKINDVKNQIYQNVYSSITNIYKQKGTNKAFRNILHAFGIDEDVVKINFYGNNVDFEIKDRYKVRATKEKFVDFNHPDRFQGSIYQYKTGSNGANFISGSKGNFEKYIPLTFETQVILPNKLSSNSVYGYDTLFTKSVIAGIHEADATDDTDYTIPGTDYCGIQLYVERDDIESKRVKFHLSSSVLGVHLSSSLYEDMYMNNEWLFAFRILNDKSPTTDLVVGSTGSDYTLDFVGYNTEANTTINSFKLSASVAAADAYNFLNSSKRIYAGAKRENFTGSIEERTDVKIGFTRYWMNYLSDDVLLNHSYDSTNFGAESPMRSAYLMQDDVNDLNVPEIDTLILNWDFVSLSKSDSNGQFLALDVSSGSGEQRYVQAFEDVKRKFYHGRGDFFLSNDEKAISVEYINAARSTYPEILQGEDMVEIRTDDDTQFTRNTLPQSYYIAFEKSMAQTISEEMIKFMSSVTDFNNLIGRPVDKYRQEYKDLNKLRQLFFERVSNEPDLDKYIDYYKWLDDSLGEMLVALVPASLPHSDGINNVIENTVLSRDKYDHKFPTIEFKTPTPEGGMNTINRHLYPWRQGHSPTSGNEDENCYWHLERKEKSEPRTKIFQARNSVLNRSFTTAQHFAVDRARAIHGGTNYEDNKKRDYIWSATKEVSESPLTYGEFGGFPLRYVLTNNDMFQSLKDCSDERPVTEKIKRAFSALDGFTAFHHDMSGGHDGIFKGGMIMPFNIMSSSVTTGYSSDVNGIPGAGQNIDIVNLHSDTTDLTNEIPMQSPFTERWVGGHQSRHAPINDGTDSEATRGEGYKILINNIQNNSGSIGVVGVDYPYPYASQADAPFFRIDQAKARYYREGRSKRPVNIKNIETTGSQVGNYNKNYEFIHTFGRFLNKTGFRDIGDSNLHNAINSTLPASNLETSLVSRAAGVNGNLASNYDSSSLYLGGVKDTTENSIAGTGRSVIATRFSAPGGFETLSEIFLDKYSKEHSAYNALPFRNLQVRGSGSGESGSLLHLEDIHGNRYGLLTHLTRHSIQGGLDSIVTDKPSFHKVNRNAKWDASEQSKDYDNYWIQHQIPQSDYQYQWVKQSHTASYATSSLAGHILSDMSEPSGASSRFPVDYVENVVVSQSAINQRIEGLTAYGFPTWEQIRNNDRNVNNQMKKTYGYSVNSQTLEESPVIENIPNTLDLKFEQSEFQFKYPYVNMKFHFIDSTLRRIANMNDNETLYDSLYGFYSQNKESVETYKKNVKQIIFPKHAKHTKYSARHRHFFVSKFWAKGENDLYNSEIDETGSYFRLDEVGRRKTNVTASLFTENSLNQQLKSLIADGYLTNIIPSQSIWSMDSRTNFTSSSPKTAASNSAGAPGVLQNQDHHFHNGLSTTELLQSGSTASGSFKLRGATRFGTYASSSFTVSGLPIGGERSYLQFDASYQMAEDGYAIYVNSGSMKGIEVDYLLPSVVTGTNLSVSPVTYRNALAITGSDYLSGAVEYSNGGQNFVLSAYLRIPTGSLTFNSEKHIYKVMSGSQIVASLFYNSGTTTASQYDLYFRHYAEDDQGDPYYRQTIFQEVGGDDKWRQYTLFSNLNEAELFIDNVAHVSESVSVKLTSSHTVGSPTFYNPTMHYIMGDNNNSEWRDQVEISDMILWDICPVQDGVAEAAFSTAVWNSGVFSPDTTHSGSDIQFRYTFGDDSGDGTRAGDNIVDVVRTFDLTIPYNLTSDFVDSKFATMKTSTQYFDQITSSLESLAAFNNYFSVYYAEYTETASSGYSTKWYHTTSFDVEPQDSTHLSTQYINSGDNLNYARFFVIAKQESSNSVYDLNPSASNGGIAIDQEKGFRNLSSINSGSAQVNALDSIEDTGITIDGTTISFNHHNNSQSGNKVNTFSSTFERCISGSVTADQVKLENSPYSNGLVSGDDISVSYWHQKAPSGTEGIVFLDSTTGNASLGALFVYHTSTTIYIRIHSGTGATEYKVWQATYASVGINYNDLNHFCWTIDVSNVSSDSAVTLYVNGTAVTLTTSTGAGFSGTFSHTYNRLQVIGTDGSSAYELVGKLCQVSIWDTVLTADDASEIYNDGRVKDLYRHRKVNRLVHWYKLGQESNLTALSIGDNLSTITTIEDSTPRGHKSDLTVNFGSTMTVENGLPDNVVSDSTFWSNLNTSIDSNVSDYNADNTGGSFTITSTSTGSASNSDTHTEDSPLITSLVSPSAGGEDESGSVSGDTITIDGTTFTIVHNASPSALQINASGVTDSQMFNAMTAAIAANTDFSASYTTASNTGSFNLGTAVTGTAKNTTMTETGDSFSELVGFAGGTNPIYRNIRFSEVIPQPRYAYPHALQSPGSLRSPTAKSNLGLIHEDYKLRSNHFALTRSLGYGTDGLFDNTSRWMTPDLSGLTPMDNDYNVWYERLRGSNKHFSLVPEFRMSSHVKSIVTSGSNPEEYFANNYWLEITGTSLDSGVTVARNQRGDASNFLEEYSTTTNIKDIDKFLEDNVVDVGLVPMKLTLTCEAIKGFLPYDGFYPQSRTVQMCEAFAESYGKGITAQEANPNDTNLGFPDNNVLAQSRPIFDAIMAPGLLYNTIKSGIAVDYPVVSSKMATASLKDPYGGTNYMITNEFFESRLPFETLLQPEDHMSMKYLVDMNPHPSSSFNLKAKIGEVSDANYKLMSNNFFAETMEFFLQDGKSSRIVSKPDSDPDFGIVVANHAGMLPKYKSIFRVYKSRKQHPYIEFSGAADIIANASDPSGAYDKYHYRPPSGTNYFLNEYQGLSGSGLEYDIQKANYPRPQMNPYAEVETITMYSQPNAFGPPCAGGVAVEFEGLSGSNTLTGDNNNTTYMMYDSTNGYNAPFTPPYYDGEAWAIYTFTPQRAGKHTLDEILQNTTVEFLRYELNHESGSYGDRGTFGPQGFTINENAMQVDASFNMFKQVLVNQPRLNREGNAWVIESKFETPILDFSKYLNREYNAEFESEVASSDIYTSRLSLSGTRQEPDTLSSVHSSLSSVHELSGILNPIGMWHQHGEFPKEADKGIFMQILDVPDEYQKLGTELTIANPKYVLVKPEISSCDGAGLNSAYNENPRDTMFPYFRKQEARRRLVGDDEFAVEGGAIQIINKSTGIIIDTELVQSDLETIYGTDFSTTGSASTNFKIFDVFRDASSLTKGVLATGSAFTTTTSSIVINGTASTDYTNATSGNFTGHWAASYYHYDRPDSYAPLLIVTKNFDSLSYDYGLFSQGFFEDFLTDFSIGVSYTDQSSRFSDALGVGCIADNSGKTVLAPKYAIDILQKNNNAITIENLSKVNMTDSSRASLGSLLGNSGMSIAPMSQEAIKINTAINSTRAVSTKFQNTVVKRKTFRLIPDNPAVAALASSDTSSYSYPEPSFVRGNIRYNAGTSSAATSVLQRSIGYFNLLPQFAPQTSNNIAANPSTVRWGQYLHANDEQVKSLADLVGFSQEPVKMGVTAESRSIKEAIVAIPYLVGERSNPEFLRLDLEKSAEDEAVINQIQKMREYVFPPHLDFLNYDVTPVPMYIFEFTKDLNRDDLTNLWQGVMSENVKKIDFEQKSITHSLSSISFLGGVRDVSPNLSALKNLRWRIFKVKQKANFSYQEKMERDLGNTPDSSSIGYNWPYDYFSLVENVKVSVDIELENVNIIGTSVDAGNNSYSGITVASISDHPFTSSDLESDDQAEISETVLASQLELPADALPTTFVSTEPEEPQMTFQDAKNEILVLFRNLIGFDLDNRNKEWHRLSNAKKRRYVRRAVNVLEVSPKYNELVAQFPNIESFVNRLEPSDYRS